MGIPTFHVLLGGGETTPVGEVSAGSNLWQEAVGAGSTAGKSLDPISEHCYQGRDWEVLAGLITHGWAGMVIDKPCVIPTLVGPGICNLCHWNSQLLWFSRSQLWSECPFPSLEGREKIWAAPPQSCASMGVWAQDPSSFPS